MTGGMRDGTRETRNDSERVKKSSSVFGQPLVVSLKVYIASLSL